MNVKMSFDLIDIQQVFDDDNYRLCSFPEEPIVASFVEKLIEGNFEQCKGLLDKNQILSRFPLHKLRDALILILQIERSYFSLDFLSSKKQFGKWQTLIQDCINILVSIDLTMSSSNDPELPLSTMLANLTTFLNIRRELGMFYDSISAVTSLEAVLDIYCLQCFESVYEHCTNLAVLFCSDKEMTLVELVTDTVSNINNLQLTSSLNSLKRSEKYLYALSQLRNSALDAPVASSAGNVAGSSGQNKGSASSASKSFTSVFWGTSAKPKINILTYLSGLISYLSALFGCYFSSTLGQISTTGYFPEWEKLFQSKNWVFSSLAAFSKANKVSCWILFNSLIDPEKDESSKSLESFLLLNSDQKPRNEKYHGIELVLSILSESQQPTFAASDSEEFLTCVCKLLRPKWRLMPTGAFYCEYVEMNPGLEFGSSSGDTAGNSTSWQSDISFSVISSKTAVEKVVRFMCCRYEHNFVIITTLPPGYSQISPPSFLNSPTAPTFSSSTRLSSMDLSYSGANGKSKKAAKSDITFKTALHATLKKLKGVSSFTILQP
ncbi:uncharacterized protein LOC142353621 isoform X2 [Convolutriloba macropyga]|uniref:uncharacterized protein LOC142353621 isoform X2 n=1 Tax=Convolutriloba macropyga TaxID=536237 RepID=UPI003F524356